MTTKHFLFALLGLSFLACNDHSDEKGGQNDYARSFSNRTEIQVNIASACEGAVYSVYYQYPYDEESLVKQPVLIARTPVGTRLEVPNDVKKLYIVGNGELIETPVEDILIGSADRATKAADTRPVNEEVLTAINSSYFPEATNNVRGNDLFKCTDLVISETGSTGNFNEAEVWMTFIGDGGSRNGGLYGKIWFYTYETGKQHTLTRGDCTFYGVVNGEIAEIPYSDIENKTHHVFYTQEEMKGAVSSYKRYLLGKFAKGLNIGFVYSGNSRIQFTTPELNEKVNSHTLKYLDGKGSFTIENRYVANGFMRHIRVGDFEGNVLGMENRSVTEAKYDGDYNDILCLLESNPLALNPSEPIDPPVIDEYRSTAGIYLFEDNYPHTGDFDFNDVVVEYKIIDYFKTSNKAKQVIARLLAKGASRSNEFGFKAGNTYSPFLTDISGYENVRAGQPYKDLGQTVTYTLYGDIKPYLYNGTHYIFDTNYNTGLYPYVLEIPVSDPADSQWQFAWCQEMKSIDDCYYFLKSATGGSRAKDWYKTPKDPSKVYVRPAPAE